MQTNEAKGGVTTSEKNPLHQWNKWAFEDLDIISEDFLNLPSPHITPTHMLSLYNQMVKRMQETEADGVVITHGTDTLEETAFFIDLLYESSIPVVLTGAMRSSDEVSSDGPNNFTTAIRTAASNDVLDTGVLVVMNEQIHSAKYVTKTHSSNVESFQSPDSGPIGVATKHEISLHFQPYKREQHFIVSSMDKVVLLVKTYAGMEESVLEHIISQPIEGVVIEGMGQGNVPPSLLKPIRSLIARDIPVVLTTRGVSGGVHNVYSYEGGGKNLKETGVIFTNRLNGPKSRLKLMAALESQLSLEDIRKTFERK